jgi:hypothetical protein
MSATDSRAPASSPIRARNPGPWSWFSVPLVMGETAGASAQASETRPCGGYVSAELSPAVRDQTRLTWGHPHGAVNSLGQRYCLPFAELAHRVVPPAAHVPLRRERARVAQAHRQRGRPVARPDASEAASPSASEVSPASVDPSRRRPPSPLPERSGGGPLDDEHPSAVITNKAGVPKRAKRIPRSAGTTHFTEANPGVRPRRGNDVDRFAELGRQRTAHQGMSVEGMVGFGPCPSPIESRRA